jgi:DNA replication protein DnaC
LITPYPSAPLAYQVNFRHSKAKMDDLDSGMRSSLMGAMASNHGAILFGPTGTGKTYAMVAAMHATEARRIGEVSYPPFFVNWAEYLGDIKRFEINVKARAYDDPSKFDPEVRLFGYKAGLFVDDIGREQFVESGYERGSSEAIFDRFIDRRTGIDLPLWITTNLSPDELV